MGFPLGRAVPAAGLALVIAGSASLILFLLVGCAPTEGESEVLPEATTPVVLETVTQQPETTTPLPTAPVDATSAGAEAETATFALG